MPASPVPPREPRAPARLPARLAKDNGPVKGQTDCGRASSWRRLAAPGRGRRHEGCRSRQNRRAHGVALGLGGAELGRGSALRARGPSVQDHGLQPGRLLPVLGGGNGSDPRGGRPRAGSTPGTPSMLATVQPHSLPRTGRVQGPARGVVPFASLATPSRKFAGNWTIGGRLIRNARYVILHLT